MSIYLSRPEPQSRHRSPDPVQQAWTPGNALPTYCLLHQFPRIRASSVLCPSVTAAMARPWPKSSSAQWQFRSVRVSPNADLLSVLLPRQPPYTNRVTRPGCTCSFPAKANGTLPDALGRSPDVWETSWRLRKVIRRVAFEYRTCADGFFVVRV
jgi:hypothetical protein